ncbi:hypothetical protein [Massilia eburnea]|uniref:hypothetical protein n=1 Tax=Massilia eburnea TaxID=1776165 RepID=UPI003D6B90A3
MPVLLLLLASQAWAQGFVSMGRLFTTPDERARLDAQRNQAPGTAGMSGTALAPAMDAAAGCPAAAPGCPPAGLTAGTTAGTQGDSEAEAAGLRLGGVIRRSDGPTMIILNGEAQAAPPGAVMRGAVTLQADGRSVVLKPGQRYDPATGAVHEDAR